MACQSSLPIIPRDFSSAATPSFKKTKSRKKVSKKNFRAILDLLAGGTGTDASYINTDSQTPPGWRIIRPTPCHLPLNLTPKSTGICKQTLTTGDEYARSFHLPFHDFIIYEHKMASSFLCVQINSQDWQLPWHPPSCPTWMVTDQIPRGPAVPRPLLSLLDQADTKRQSSTLRLLDQASGSYPFGTFCQCLEKLKSVIPHTFLQSDREADSMEINGTLIECHLYSSFLKSWRSSSAQWTLRVMLQKCNFKTALLSAQNTAAIIMQSCARKINGGKGMFTTCQLNERTYAKAHTQPHDKKKYMCSF